MMIWTEQFSVGVKKLDEQHQKLFRVVNDLIENQGAIADAKVIADVLQRMTEYAGYHFTTEERIMLEYGYPEYASQVREHTEFKTQTARFCMDAINKKTGLSGEILGYLQNWVINHTLESDVKFKHFLKDHGFLPVV
jgi:hemerythrin-like metal-binding protein